MVPFGSFIFGVEVGDGRHWGKLSKRPNTSVIESLSQPESITQSLPMTIVTDSYAEVRRKFDSNFHWTSKP